MQARDTLLSGESSRMRGRGEVTGECFSKGVTYYVNGTSDVCFWFAVVLSCFGAQCLM